MPIIKETKDVESSFYFIFSENNILLSEKQTSKKLVTLPGKEIYNTLLESFPAALTFFDSEYKYTAMMLPKDVTQMAGTESIPLRQFFWQSKTEEEQQKGLPSVIGSLAARAHGFLRLMESYIYCPKCGTKLKPDTTETAMKCPSCGRLDFPHIEPAIIVLVHKGNDLLLVKNRNFKGDYYGCVSGFVEMGESIENCVRREVKEETNIDIKNIRYVGSQAWPFPDQLMLAFNAEYAGGEIKKQEKELLDAKWFNKDALPPLPPPGSVAYNLLHGLFG